MQRFLRFLCDEMLAGRGTALREYAIALTVFDKPTDFDPGCSASIRVEAGRLRRLLAQYELECGQADALRLRIPKGGYCPVFEYKFPERPVGADAAAGETAELRRMLLASGERRCLTVICCSFGEASDACARVDDEFLRAYERAHAQCVSIANRQGAMIDAGASDRINIYFGWPEALEDAAGRAVAVAFQIAAALRESLAMHGGVRVSVATSEVVVRCSTEQTLFIGPALALAGKMVSLAPRGGVLVCEHTRRLSRTASDRVAAGSMPHPLGRDEEVRFLLSRWRLAVSGQGQAVVVEGEAGIGKSCVADAAAREIGPESLQLRIQCSPHPGDSALGPWIDLHRQLGSNESEPTVRGLLSLLTAHAERRPTLLLIEDIHWADPGAIELIDRIVAATTQLRMCLIMTGRPAAAARLPWHSNVAVLRLSRLSGLVCNTMLDRLSCSAPLTTAARSIVLSKAEGVPRFLEELAKCFANIEAGASSPELVPPSLQPLLAAQLGRPGLAPQVARIAAVIGRDFSSALLQSITGLERAAIQRALDQLIEAGVLTRSTSDSDDMFSFRHGLLREAAYRSVLDADRRKLQHRLASIQGNSQPQGGSLEGASEFRRAERATADAATRRCVVA